MCQVVVPANEGRAAAAAVATHVGLGPTRPQVISAGWECVVALEPLPVIARVSRVNAGSAGLTSPELQIELAAHVSARGGPVVPPLAGGAGPHVVGEFIVTLWDRIPDHPKSPREVGRSLRRWHHIIADFPGALPSFDPRSAARRIAAELPADAHETAAVLRSACDKFQIPDLPVQPLHGDAHLGNALGSPDGPLWTDLEYACVGPIEWDLACAAHQATVLGQHIEKTDALLSAYADDAADRAAVLAEGVGLHMAAQTISAAAARPGLTRLAERRLEWLRSRLR